MIQHEPMSLGDYINLAINYLSTQNTRQIWMVMRNFHLILLNHLCISFDKYDILHKLNRNSSCALVNVGYRPIPLNYQTHNPKYKFKWNVLSKHKQNYKQTEYYQFNMLNISIHGQEQGSFPNTQNYRQTNQNSGTWTLWLLSNGFGKIRRKRVCIPKQQIGKSLTRIVVTFEHLTSIVLCCQF